MSQLSIDEIEWNVLKRLINPFLDLINELKKTTGHKASKKSAARLHMGHEYM